MHFIATFARLLAAAALTSAAVLPTSDAEDGPEIHHFQSAVADVGLRYVNNSGICETTPGVHTMSGYVDISSTMHTWFWFFAARNAPDTAPFTLCWNNASNMIYIDQPIGTGFSYGTDSTDSTYTAAPYVWQAFQVLFESTEFSAYKSREFILATESYGGHYGPEFAEYFEIQNNAIAAGTITGVQIKLSALMINNGWIDPLIQNGQYITFAQNAPGYGALQSASTIKKMNTTYYGSNGCLAQQQNCYAAGNSTGSTKICVNADNYCGSIGNDAIGNLDPYDLRQSSAASFPPEYYVNYLALSSVTKAIGATSSTYSECPDAPYEGFAKTGDDARTLLPQLGNVVDSGLRVLIWAGDADIICNWLGGHAAVLAMTWSGSAALAATPLTNITLAGTPIAAVQNVKNFTFARVYGAGHEVPAAALAIFEQIIAGQPLHSV
ncbi:hypothetical protein HWV62_17010 [Athelia sp. TMB]|nr:hypothetical protein HWV62_17010 [Athelia sp. TMB]